MTELRRVLIVDVETGGLDPQADPVIEVAGVLLDVEHGEVIGAASLLQGAPINRAEHVNQIPSSLLRSLPGSMSRAPRRDATDPAFQPLFGLIGLADAFVAHRATFDRKFFPESIARLLPWICSKFSCDWPRGRYGDHLVDLALAHGVAVTANHRALDDCMLLARIMRRVRRDYGWPNGQGNALRDVLRGGLERGVGEPPRCRHGLERGNQCRNYLRTYIRDENSFGSKNCADHGGSAQWVS